MGVANDRCTCNLGCMLWGQGNNIYGYRKSARIKKTRNRVKMAAQGIKALITKNRKKKKDEEMKLYEKKQCFEFMLGMKVYHYYYYYFLIR